MRLQTATVSKNKKLYQYYIAPLRTSVSSIFNASFLISQHSISCGHLSCVLSPIARTYRRHHRRSLISFSFFIFAFFRRVTLQQSWFSRGPPLIKKRKYTIKNTWSYLKYKNTIIYISIRKRKSKTKTKFVSSKIKTLVLMAAHF